MPGLAVDSGVGTTITFGTSAFSAEITEVRWTGVARAAFETSHMGTAAPSSNHFGNKTFIPSKLSDPGSLNLTVHFNAQTNPPIDAVPETITVTWPKAPADTTAATWAASGFVTSFEVTDQLEAVMVATMTVKLTGNVTMTDAA